MRQVLLIDDEYLVRERLKRGVDWASYGFRVAAEADNGEDGLALLAELPIDVAIIDINMPIVDGLEFARIAGERYPELKMVFLTGYGTFDYAQAALRAGARDYLLKPIDMNDFKTLLAKLDAELREEAANRAAHDRVVSQLQASETLVRERWLRHWLEGALPWDAEAFARHCPRLADADAYVVLAIAAPDGGEGEEGGAAAGAGAALADALAAAWPQAEAVHDAGGRKRLLVAGLTAAARADGAGGADGMGSADGTNGADGADCAYGADELARACEALLSAAAAAGDAAAGDAAGAAAGAAAARAGAGELASVGMSAPFADPARAPAAAREASYALSYRTLRGEGRLFRFGRLDARPPATEWMAIRERLLILLRLGNESTVANAIDEWLADCRRPDASMEQLYLLLGEIVAALRLHAAEHRSDADELLPASLQPHVLVERLARLEAIRDWLQERAARILERVAQSRRSTTSLLAEKAKDYIDREFANPELDLNGIAGVIAVNPSYLSRVFKQETGYSVVEYVTLRRLTRAKEMLDRGVRNLTYISEAVGYADAMYFSKIFKKQYGVPPSHFASKST